MLYIPDSDLQARNGACFLWQAKNDPASQAKKADPSKKADVKPTPTAKKPVEKKEGQYCMLRCLIQTFTVHNINTYFIQIIFLINQ